MQIETYRRMQLGLLAVIPVVGIAFHLRLQPLVLGSLIVMIVGVPAVLTAGGEDALRQSKSMLGTVVLGIAWLVSAFLLGAYLLIRFVFFGPGTTFAD